MGEGCAGEGVRRGLDEGCAGEGVRREGGEGCAGEGVGTGGTGALVREWPRGFSIWVADETASDGYTHLQSFVREPTTEIIFDLLDVSILHHILIL